MTMRVLVLGSGGMLGRAVVRAAARLGHDVIALTRAQLDITDAAHVARVVAVAAPRAVVNCAAFTDVDRAEGNEAWAMRVNGDGAGNVARAAAEAGARVVHVSTDYVFDGSKREPWVESDPVGPLQAYGRTKVAGERAVAGAAPEHAIVRAGWLFGAGGRNFVDTILRLASERDEVSVVTDQQGGPTWTGHLAPALVEIAERRLAGVTPEQHVRAMVQMCFGDPARVPAERIEQAVQEMRERSEQPWADRALVRTTRGLMSSYLRVGRSAAWAANWHRTPSSTGYVTS
jgi:dTDP-4-dehydrorhamnose reductase